MGGGKETTKLPEQDLETRGEKGNEGRHVERKRDSYKIHRTKAQKPLKLLNRERKI